MRLKQCEDEPAAGEGNEAFGSVASWHQVTDACGRYSLLAVSVVHVCMFCRLYSSIGLNILL